MRKKHLPILMLPFWLEQCPGKKAWKGKILLNANAKIFKTQGDALNKYAKKTCKVVVVGNPANTNCLIASRCASSIPKENFTCLTRPDHNRAIAQVTSRLGIQPHAAKNVIIWGNHSSTHYPDVRVATVDGKELPVMKAV